MPYEDFMAFQLKTSISPIKNQRADSHHALLMWQMERINSDPKTFNRSPDDYRPFKQKQQQTIEEIEKAIDATLSRL